MVEKEPTSVAGAIEFALSILEPFRESSIYDDYQTEDGWTDDQFEMALGILHKAADPDEIERQHYFIVDAAKPLSGTDFVAPSCPFPPRKLRIPDHS
jgi:hypothetical protein